MLKSLHRQSQEDAGAACVGKQQLGLPCAKEDTKAWWTVINGSTVDRTRWSERIASFSCVSWPEPPSTSYVSPTPNKKSWPSSPCSHPSTLAARSTTEFGCPGSFQRSATPACSHPVAPLPLRDEPRVRRRISSMFRTVVKLPGPGGRGLTAHCCDYLLPTTLGQRTILFTFHRILSRFVATVPSSNATEYK